MLPVDLDPNPEQPQITLVVVPRERFSLTQRSLESLYAHTGIPFQLVYVDGNSPPHIHRYLKEQSQARGFQLIRTEHYLSPNQARNIGWKAVNTPYMAFVDNDVIVSPGWLETLFQCARETGAAIVGPLMCEREPVHTIVHCAGGENHVWQDAKGSRHLREKMYKQGQKVEQVVSQLQPQPTELAEFHCMFLRTDLREKVGFLDEGMLNTKEHLDFCMMATQAGETIYFEPRSIVTYVPGPPAHWSDVAFYMLRWSNQWTQASLEHLRQKWDLVEDSYFKTKLKKLGWRRRMTIWQPLNRQLTRGRTSDRLNEWLLHPLDRLIEGWLIRRYQQQSGSPQAKT
ncbi:MAG: glycosyltransferase [Thermostichus sp. BF3_bins_97]